MHLAARWRSPSLGANVTIVGNAAGAESAALEVLARRAGCDYVVNLEWPAQGWEVGAYKAGAAALARRGVPGVSAIVFAQDSLEMHEPERFADALARWQAAGMTPACLMTFPKHVGFTPLVASRLKAWLGARYNEHAEWRGCTFNSFIASWADLAALEELGIFAPNARDRFDSNAVERYFGYVLSRTYGAPDPLCGRDLFGRCGLHKAHLSRPQ